MLNFSEVPELVRNGVQRPRDIRQFFNINARMATTSKSAIEAFLGDRSLSEDWYSSPALGDQLQKSGTVKMVEIRDDKKQLVCLLPENEWHFERGYNVFLEALYSLLASTKVDDSRCGDRTPECSSPRGSVGTPNSTSNRSQRDLPGDWEPGYPGSDPSDEEIVDLGPNRGDASDCGELESTPKRVKPGPKRAVDSSTPTASPSDSTPKGKTLSGMALRAYRKWKESHLSSDSAKAESGRLLAQSRAQQSLLERLHRSGSGGSRRDSTRSVSPTEITSAMRFWTDVRRSQKQPRQFLINPRVHNEPVTPVDVLPRSDVPNRKRERPRSVEKAVKFSRAVSEYGRSSAASDRTPRPLGKPSAVDSSRLKLVRSRNISAPRQSPVPFRGLSDPGDVPNYGYESDSGEEPDDSISIGSNDSPRSVSDEEDSDQHSESTNDTLVLDEEAALEYDAKEFGNPQLAKRPIKKRFICASSEESE